MYWCLHGRCVLLCKCHTLGDYDTSCVLVPTWTLCTVVLMPHFGRLRHKLCAGAYMDTVYCCANATLWEATTLVVCCYMDTVYCCANATLWEATTLVVYWCLHGHCVLLCQCYTMGGYNTSCVLVPTRTLCTVVSTSHYDRLRH